MVAREFEYRRRRRKHQTQLRYRPYSLSMKSSLEVRKLTLLTSLVLSGLIGNDLVEEDHETLLILHMLKKTHWRWEKQGNGRSNPRRKARSIDSFTESECLNYFRVNKVDLPRVLEAFQIPKIVRLPLRRLRFTGEEVLLLSLHKFAHDHTFDCLVDLFGRENSQWSCAFSWFVTHMHATFNHLLTNCLGRFYGENGERFKKSARAIGRKIVAKTPAFSQYFDPNTSRVFAFVDGNLLKVSVPGGPLEPGANAPRFNKEAQKEVYNGWKKLHGVKHSAVTDASGMVLDLYGPLAGKLHDTTAFILSKMNAKLAHVQRGQDVKYCLYGDKAYSTSEYLIRPYKGSGISRYQRLENRAFRKARISIEWDFGRTSRLFKFLRNSANFKLRSKSRNHTRYYFVATLLSNAINCLYGGITSNYFNCQPPSLEEYFSW